MLGLIICNKKVYIYFITDSINRLSFFKNILYIINSVNVYYLYQSIYSSIKS